MFQLLSQKSRTENAAASSDAFFQIGLRKKVTFLSMDDEIDGMIHSTNSK